MKELFDLCTNSEGGITWDIAYDMPIFYRRFNLEQIIERREKENEAANNQKGTITEKNVMKKITQHPDKKPDFKTKAPKR
jgi:hypothetical protein